MSREIVITGLGPVSGLGLGVDAHRDGWFAGRSALGPLRSFDAPALASRLVAEVPDFKTRDHVPKSYRKSLKVMARDIELAVVAARFAAIDAGLRTADEATVDLADAAFAPDRLGCHIGSGLIATELDELFSAIAGSADGDALDLHRWGSGGMQQLTPLWLLKYLPNMLACHVSIIHDARGPSNTITCNEASGGLSIGESFRVIARGQADACFCGGTESKINPMGLVRQQLTGRLAPSDGSDASAVRPFDQHAAGTAIGEGGAIVLLEAADTFRTRTRGTGREPWARLAGFGAAQTMHPEARNQRPDAEGAATQRAAGAALADAGLTPADVDFVIPTGLGVPGWDAAEAAALRALLGERLSEVPLLTPRAALGTAGAGNDGLDLALACAVLRDQRLPPALHRDHPLPGCDAAQADRLETGLLTSTALGGQTAALVVTRCS